MINRYVIILMVIFTSSCKAQMTSKESDKINNAKWYYYCYASELKIYDKSNLEVQAWICDIKFLRRVQVGPDTTQLFFTIFNRDSLNLCYFKPMELVGVTTIKDKLYIPIYHAIAFDSENDSIVLERMKKQSLFLRNKVLENIETANLWLQAEAKKRE